MNGLILLLGFACDPRTHRRSMVDELSFDNTAGRVRVYEDSPDTFAFVLHGGTARQALIPVVLTSVAAGSPVGSKPNGRSTLTSFRLSGFEGLQRFRSLETRV